LQQSLLEALTWREVHVPSTSAAGTVPLKIGEAGTGKPRGLIVASQHGDEGPWGTRAIRKFLESTPASDLVGSIRVVPVMNPMAFDEQTRESHIDAEDLNSLLPGDPDGRHTERLGHAVVTEVAPDVDILIDVHGGGHWCLNGFVYKFAGSEDLAHAIGGDFVRFGHERGEASLTCYLRNRGAKVVWLEMGGAGTTEELWAQRIADGARRAFGNLGVLKPSSLPEPKPAQEIPEAKSFRTPKPGLYLPALREADVATVVDGGTLIGTTIDSVTNDVIHEFRAPFAKTAVMLIRPRLAVVEAGEMICVMGNAG
jgi:predicted deacylase